MEGIGPNRRLRVCFVQFARWRHQLYVSQHCLVEIAKWRHCGQVCRHQLYFVLSVVYNFYNSPTLVEYLFYRNAGGVSFVWWIFWNIFVYSSPENHPLIDPVEKNYIMTTVGTVAYEQVSRTRTIEIFTILLNQWRRFALVVTRWSRLTTLLYVEPGLYLDGWQSSGGQAVSYVTIHPVQLSLASDHPFVGRHSEYRCRRALYFTAVFFFSFRH